MSVRHGRSSSSRASNVTFATAVTYTRLPVMRDSCARPHRAERRRRRTLPGLVHRPRRHGAGAGRRVAARRSVLPVRARSTTSTIIDLLAVGAIGSEHRSPVPGRRPRRCRPIVNVGRFTVVDGPDIRFGARGNGRSIYVKDPDGNTVEFRSYDWLNRKGRRYPRLTSMNLASLPPLLRDEPALTQAFGDPNAVIAVPEAARPIAIAALQHLSARRPLVVACPTGTAAGQLYDDLAAVHAGRRGRAVPGLGDAAVRAGQPERGDDGPPPRGAVAAARRRARARR